jgi:hypothetical protein
VLGTDVFHMVVQFLPIADLLTVERVCKKWQYFSQTNNALWRYICIRERVDQEEIWELDTIEHAKVRVYGQRSPWRQLCEFN